MTVLPLSIGGCTPTGIAGTAAQGTELKVFPNPNTGTFTLNLLSADNEPVQVIITNVVGEKVMEFTTATNKEQEVKINRKAGIYFISAITAHGTNTVKVMITN
jgi:hypothetical protein